MARLIEPLGLFIKWLFSTSDGHFSLTIIILAICAIAAVAGVPQAAIAVGAVWPIVLAKLK